MSLHDASENQLRDLCAALGDAYSAALLAGFYHIADGLGTWQEWVAVQLDARGHDGLFDGNEYDTDPLGHPEEDDDG